MRKKESVHLHALLAVILEESRKGGDVPETTLEGYPEEYVAPSDVHRAKGHHEAAVQALARALATELPQSEDAMEAPVAQ